MTERHALSFQSKLTTPVCQVGGTKFVQLSMEAGQTLPEHKTPNHLAVIVLTGKVQFGLNGEETTLGSSEMITVAPSVVHSVTAVEKSTILLVLTPEK